jgi:IclR family pca regulon transcriptional regulator
MHSFCVRILTFFRLVAEIVRIVNTRTDHIAAFAKGLKVIACFGADRSRLSIAEVATLTGLDRATALPADPAQRRLCRL